jgi:uncharacterized protein YodC (DUF2158 family)
MDTVKEIASVKAGSFQAWFDQVNGRYEIQWYEGASAKAFGFDDEEIAKTFWHEYVIDRYQFKHCYCC